MPTSCSQLGAPGAATPLCSLVDLLRPARPNPPNPTFSRPTLTPSRQ